MKLEIKVLRASDVREGGFFIRFHARLLLCGSICF